MRNTPAAINRERLLLCEFVAALDSRHSAKPPREFNNVTRRGPCRFTTWQRHRVATGPQALGRRIACAP